MTLSRASYDTLGSAHANAVAPAPCQRYGANPRSAATSMCSHSAWRRANAASYQGAGTLTPMVFPRRNTRSTRRPVLSLSRCTGFLSLRAHEIVWVDIASGSDTSRIRFGGPGRRHQLACHLVACQSGVRCSKCRGPVTCNGTQLLRARRVGNRTFRLWELILADNAEAEFVESAVSQLMQFIHHMVMTTLKSSIIPGRLQYR
jgi:hypothetical protein